MRRTPVIRQAVRAVVGVLLWLFTVPSIALAHGGGMSGEDLRPMAVSIGLGLVGYWTVILWPRRRKAPPDYFGPLKKKKRSGPGRWA
jgi:hypothetical protein